MDWCFLCQHSVSEFIFNINESSPCENCNPSEDYEPFPVNEIQDQDEKISALLPPSPPPSRTINETKDFGGTKIFKLLIFVLVSVLVIGIIIYLKFKI